MLPAALYVAVPAVPAMGAGHPVQSLSDMRRTEARRAQINRPEGVSRRFHVSLYSVEPCEAVLARNLFANCHDRSERQSEGLECWPKMSVVAEAFALSGRAPRLAREAGAPERAAVGPSGAPSGVTPDADPGEEMALGKSNKLIWPNIADIPFVDLTGRNMAIGDQHAQPSCGLRVDLVVKGERSAQAAMLGQ